jgi:hypothetical protein
MQLTTRISEAYWCGLENGRARFQPAQVGLGDEAPRQVSWFDRLFEGGIVLPEGAGRPLTFPITGPPGSGKSTLAMELCYRLAAADPGELSLYISTEAEANALIANARDLGHDAGRHIIELKEPVAPPVPVVCVWGVSKVRRWKEISELAVDALDALGKFLRVEIPWLTRFLV